MTNTNGLFVISCLAMTLSLAACGPKEGAVHAEGLAQDSSSITIAKPSVAISAAQIETGPSGAPLIKVLATRAINGAEDVAFTGHLALHLKCKITDQSSGAVVFENANFGTANSHLHISMPANGTTLPLASADPVAIGLQTGVTYQIELQLENAFHGTGEASYDVSSEVNQFTITF